MGAGVEWGEAEGEGLLRRAKRAARSSTGALKGGEARLEVWDVLSRETLDCLRALRRARRAVSGSGSGGEGMAGGLDLVVGMR